MEPETPLELISPATGFTLLFFLLWLLALLLLHARWDRRAHLPIPLFGIALLMGFLTPGPVPLLRDLLGMHDTLPAALLEELLKGAAIGVVLLAMVRRRPDRRPGIETGLLAGAAVGLGFAFVENLINLHARDLLDPTLVAVQRGIVANPGHMVYSAAFGVGLALLWWGRPAPVQVVGATFLILSPVAHGLHNHLVTAAFAQGTWVDVAASAGFLSVMFALEALLLNLLGGKRWTLPAPTRRK